MNTDFDEDEEILAVCEQCGAETNPEDLIDGLCPDCYARSLGPPEGCDAPDD